MPSLHSLYSLMVTLIVFGCFYMDMNCFGLVRVVLSWLWVSSVAADSLGCVVGIVSGGFRWFWMVSDGRGWFRLVYCFSGYVFRIYETRKTFNCVIHTTSVKSNCTIRDMSSSLTEMKYLTVFILLKLKRKITSKHFIHQLI